MLRVEGLASSLPLEPADPQAPANRRISIIVMNRDAEDRLLRPELAAATAEAQESAARPDRIAIAALPAAVPIRP